MNTPTPIRPDIEAVIPEFESRRPLTQGRIDRPMARPASISGLVFGEPEPHDLQAIRDAARDDRWGTVVAVAIFVAAVFALIWIGAH